MLATPSTSSRFQGTRRTGFFFETTLFNKSHDFSSHSGSRKIKKTYLLDEYVEHYDTLRNNYSNFYYGVSFDGNDNWLSNIGETEHSIFRTYQIDSALSFSIVEAAVTVGFRYRVQV